MRTKAILLGSFIFVLQSCIPSLYPFYTKDLLTFSPALIGTWRVAETKQGEGITIASTEATWHFTRKDDHTYTLEIRTPQSDGWFDAHLFKIGDQLFLDTYPKKSSVRQQSAYDCLEEVTSLHTLRTHHLWRIQLNDGHEIQLDMIDPDWFDKETIKQQSRGLYLTVNDTPVFTATSEQLVAWLQQHMSDPGMWGTMYELKREQ